MMIRRGRRPARFHFPRDCRKTADTPFSAGGSAVVLAVTLAVLTVALAAIFWGLSLFLQGYLYSMPASRLPLRALTGALAVSCFLTLWVFVNTRAESENKYGTFFEFNPTGAKEITQFEAVRYVIASKEEKVVPFTLQSGTKPPAFVDAEGQKFKLADSGSGTITVALNIELDGKKSRFDAEMREDPRVGKVYSTDNKLFKEKGGSRYLEGETPYLVFAPSGAALFFAIALNVLMFVVWFVAFWPILQYLPGHAIGLAFVFGLVTMVVLMPLLFKLNKPKPAAPGVVAVAATAFC
jgi:hypothetical protein